MIEDVTILTDDIVDFAQTMQSRLETASYPMQNSAAELRTRFERALANEQDRLLVCRDGDRLRGVACLWVERENNYLQTGGVFVAKDVGTFYDELLAFIGQEYRGFELNVGIPAENLDATKALLTHGAECMEASTFTKLTPDGFVPFEGITDIRRVTEADFDAFAEFHDTHNLDMYWTATRVREKFDDWLVYAVWHNDCVVGCALCSVWADDSSEIYAVTLDDSVKSIENYRALQSIVASDVFEHGKQSIVYMVEEDSPLEREAALQTGFQITGNYRDYKLIV